MVGGVYILRDLIYIVVDLNILIFCHENVVCVLRPLNIYSNKIQKTFTMETNTMSHDQKREQSDLGSYCLVT